MRRTGKRHEIALIFYGSWQLDEDKKAWWRRNPGIFTYLSEEEEFGTSNLPLIFRFAEKVRHVLRQERLPFQVHVHRHPFDESKSHPVAPLRRRATSTFIVVNRHWHTLHDFLALLS